MNSYFNAKSELKKIYMLGQKAIKSKDSRTINFLISNLDKLKSDLNTHFVMDALGIYMITKQIKQMRQMLIAKLK